MANSIAENLENVFTRLERAARKAGRDPGEVTLVAASKTVEPKRIKEAISAGARVFGENYVQEAKEKIEKTKRKPVKWHFIGHLQKNKAKAAVEMFDMIETIDSIELAREISKKAKTAKKEVDVLIEVNIAKERSKSGVTPKQTERLAKQIAALENLKLRGLMAIPPIAENPEATRPYFITLRRIAERINKERIDGVFLHELSMGMSNDFEVAVE
ncbi:MAG: YggS family pyridoxal phosphate-dependent enzyme, partial [Desulfobacterales bacterium]|nr:YggS family pyridoxal phosphate-dependent enzyme [Desulfobacterales bacterium]